MSDNNFELSRRKILGSLGVIGAASAGAGMGTTAFLNDEESFENNTLTAGELDLRIDWQQQYWGPATSAAPASTYGSAGRPYVNAHPDDDGDGIQSLDKDDDGTDEYKYTDVQGGKNIADKLTCSTLTNDYDFGPNDDSLIELLDVKPGDRGEVTFSFHLCDNPGYIWMTGGGWQAKENGVNEPEASSSAEDQNQDGTLKEGSGEAAVELAEKLEARAWYDLDCDNSFDAGESIIFKRGKLKDVVADLSSEARLLNPLAYDDFTVEDDGETEDTCLELGKIEWNGNKFVPESDDADDATLAADVQKFGRTWDQEIQLTSDDSNAVPANLLIEVTETKDGGEPLEVDWQIDLDDTPDVGICRIDVTGGGTGGGQQITTKYDPGICATGSNDRLVVDGTVGNGNQPAISNIVFHYCPADDEPDLPLCFDANSTYCIGFEWWLPPEVGNEVQSDSVEFDLGFYTEQCRHNASPTGPS